MDRVVLSFGEELRGRQTLPVDNELKAIVGGDETIILSIRKSESVR